MVGDVNPDKVLNRYAPNVAYVETAMRIQCIGLWIFKHSAGLAHGARN